MALWSRRERVALALGADRARLLVARGNGRLKAVHESAAPLPAGAIRPGLKGPNIVDREAVGTVVRRLQEEARAEGHLDRKPEIVAIVLADSAIRLAASPVDGDAPGRAEGERMARWVLRELLPSEAGDTRVDWSIVTTPEVAQAVSGGDPLTTGAGTAVADEAPEADSWLVALGAEASVVGEYEELVHDLGWTPGRVIPWTMALSIGVQRDLEAENGRGRGGEDAGVRRRLLVCEQGGQLACLLEADAIPRFHRAWRGRVGVDDLPQELEAVQRFINDRLEMTVGEAWLCGSDDWVRAAAGVAEGLGWKHRLTGTTRALLGALHA